MGFNRTPDETVNMMAPSGIDSTAASASKDRTFSPPASRTNSLNSCLNCRVPCQFAQVLRSACFSIRWVSPKVAVMSFTNPASMFAVSIRWHKVMPSIIEAYPHTEVRCDTWARDWISSQKDDNLFQKGDAVKRIVSGRWVHIGRKPSPWPSTG